MMSSQDSIVDDASVMVSELRERSLQARKAVRDDIATLDATGQLIEANRAKLDQNNERLREQVMAVACYHMPFFNHNHRTPHKQLRLGTPCCLRRVMRRKYFDCSRTHTFAATATLP
eukprot:scaffold54379_cov33-Tisochrysis_lutea.AAC.2